MLIYYCFIAGLLYRWKYVVAHHITPKKLDSMAVKIVTEEIITKVEEETGVEIEGYGTDMASVNMYYWKVCGITASRKGPVVCEIPHPRDSTRKLVIFADSLHLLKNCKCSLENNKEFELSDEIVKKYELPSNKVLYR